MHLYVLGPQYKCASRCAPKCIKCLNFNFVNVKLLVIGLY